MFLRSHYLELLNISKAEFHLIPYSPTYPLNHCWLSRHPEAFELFIDYNEICGVETNQNYHAIVLDPEARMG